MTLLLTQNPNLTAIIGDLLLSAMDFKEAGEAAQRLKRMVPPQALGQGPTETEQQLQLQIDELQAAAAKSQEALTKALQQAAEKQIKLLSKEELRDVQVYDAQTRRTVALKEYLPLDQDGLKSLITELIQQAMQTQIASIAVSNELGG